MNIKANRYGNRWMAHWGVRVSWRYGLAVEFSFLFWWIEIIFWGFDT